MAQARVVDTVDVRARADGYEITVNFNLPMRYQGHAPKDAATFFVIELRSGPFAQTTEEDISAQLSDRVDLSWDKSSGAPLSQLTYEGGSSTRPTMAFKFDKPVHIDAHSSSDQRSLIVTVITSPQQTAITSPPPSADLKPRLEVFDDLATTKAPQAANPAYDAALAEAFSAMETNDFPRAIQLYTKVAEQGDAAQRQKAQELLGIARERNGQKNQAKAEYDKYLSAYPEGPAADRVRQRLAALVTVTGASKSGLREQKVAAKKPSDWRSDIYGSVSQFYFRNDIKPSNAPKQVYLSRLANDVDLNARIRNDAYDIRALFVGSYDKDLISHGHDDTRIYNLSLEIKGIKNGIFGRVGRQSLSSAGIFGRFDGARLGYSITPGITISGVYGYPVERSTDTHINSKRYFYGTNVSFGSSTSPWGGNIYALEQRDQGLIDRRAVGGEIKYFESTKSLFALADYDIFYKDLNLLMIFGTWTLHPGTTVNVNLDYRNSPFLTTKSAIQGQNVDNLGDLFSRFNQDELYSLAKDRTARSKTGTIGITQDLNDKLQLTAEATASTLSGTVTSGGVEGYNSTGTDIYLNSQLIATNLLSKNDIISWGLRYYKSSNYHSYGTSLNARFPITENLRINPRILLDYRKSANTDSTRLLVRPLLRLDYRVKRWLQIEAEGGVEWQDERTFNLPQRSLGTFLYVGYRVFF